MVFWNISCLLLSMPGTTEIIIIAVVIIILFGAKKIPEFAKGLGKGIKEFKDAKNEDKENEDKDNLKEK